MTSDSEANSIAWLQSWYEAQCDDTWEHRYGIKIETLDNPGWTVRIDLTRTPLERAKMPPVKTGEINHVGLEGDHTWLDCKVENKQFDGAGGPASLLRIIDVFREWAIETELRTA